MNHRFTKSECDLREKIVGLLLSNPNHVPSCQCIHSDNGADYKRPLDYSTIGLAEKLIKYIQQGTDEANDYESLVIDRRPESGL